MNYLFFLLYLLKSNLIILSNQNLTLQFIKISIIRYKSFYQLKEKMSNSFDYLFKFILIGDSSVGKSCLLNRFVQGRFKNEHDPTLGVEFGCKILTIDSLILKIQIWDTAGQQSFKSITRSYYKGSVAAFLVFDITSRVSFQNVNKWLFQIKNYSHQNIQIILIGNKADLSQNRQISTQEAQKFAIQNKYQYFQTSALTGLNVNEPFQTVTKKILFKIQRKQIDPQSQNTFGIKVGRKKKDFGSQQQKMKLKYSSSKNGRKNCKC